MARFANMLVAVAALVSAGSTRAATIFTETFDTGWSNGTSTANLSGEGAAANGWSNRQASAWFWSGTGGVGGSGAISSGFGNYYWALFGKAHGLDLSAEGSLTAKIDVGFNLNGATSTKNAGVWLILSNPGGGGYYVAIERTADTTDRLTIGKSPTDTGLPGSQKGPYGTLSGGNDVWPGTGLSLTSLDNRTQDGRSSADQSFYSYYLKVSATGGVTTISVWDSRGVNGGSEAVPLLSVTDTNSPYALTDLTVVGLGARGAGSPTVQPLLDNLVVTVPSVSTASLLLPMAAAGLMRKR